MEVKNIMEVFVQDNLDKVLEGTHSTCRCEICRADIAAYALNKLKPKYVTTDKGEIYSKAQALEPQFYLDVITAITQAVEVVGKNIRHE